jgi:hypothetical protein
MIGMQAEGRGGKGKEVLLYERKGVKRKRGNCTLYEMNIDKSFFIYI